MGYIMYIKRALSDATMKMTPWWVNMTMFLCVGSVDGIRMLNKSYKCADEESAFSCGQH